MVDQPWFSVIIPFYNAITYLEEAVCSVTGQTFSDCEIILVNDGSDDGSRDVAARLAEADGRIRLIDLPDNAGAAAARNEGVAQAKGRYLMFLDADDVYEQGLLERVKAAAEYFSQGQMQGQEASRQCADGQHAEGDAPLGVVSGALPEVIVWGVVEEDYLPRGEVRVMEILPEAAVCRTKEQLRYHALPLEQKGIYGYLWNKAYLREAYRGRGILIPQQQFNEDEMANIAFFAQAQSAVLVPQAYTRYRRRPAGSLTHRYLPDYYGIATRRVAALLRQQAAWGLDSEDARAVLAEYLLRYDLSALMRLADSRCELRHHDKRKMVRDMRNGALARELLPSAKPSSAPLKLLFRLIAEEHVEACLFLGRAVWFVRTHLPGIYGRLAGV